MILPHSDIFGGIEALGVGGLIKLPSICPRLCRKHALQMTVQCISGHTVPPCLPCTCTGNVQLAVPALLTAAAAAAASSSYITFKHLE